MSKKNLPINTGFAHIEILLVILAVAVLGISIFFVQRNAGTPIPQDSPTPGTMFEADMVDWETYTNDKLKFSVNYLNTMEPYILDENTLGDDQVEEEGYVLYFRVARKGQARLFKWILSVYSRPFETIVKDLKNPSVSKTDPPPCVQKVKEEKDVTLGNKAGVELIMSCTAQDTKEILENVYWVFEHEGNTFVFAPAAYAGTKEAAFDNILSTFEFIEKTQNTTNLNPSKNKEWNGFNNNLGFSISPPASWTVHNNPPNGSGVPVVEKDLNLKTDDDCDSSSCADTQRVFIQFIDMEDMVGSKTGNSDLDIRSGESFSDWVSRYLNNKDFVSDVISDYSIEISENEELEIAKLVLEFRNSETRGVYIFRSKPTGQKIYAEMYLNYNENKESFDKILSTFKFTK